MSTYHQPQPPVLTGRLSPAVEVYRFEHPVSEDEPRSILEQDRHPQSEA